MAMRAFVSVVAVAHYAVTVWHLYLAQKLNPALPTGELVRIATFAGALTLVGVALVWTQRLKVGSLVLIVVFAIGLVQGTAEHFFIPGPNNVFDVSAGPWAFPFTITVALLPVLEIAGLSAAGRVLLTRAATRVSPRSVASS
jgi:hypothetical protein